jgi:hypothetical protein
MVLDPVMTEPIPWQSERLDLDAYLARIGVPAASPSRKALDELHEAHVRTFTFDNIDVLLEPAHHFTRPYAARAGPRSTGGCATASWLTGWTSSPYL